MNVSILIGSYGDLSYARMAETVALPSAVAQQPLEVIQEHEWDGTIASCRNRLADKAKGEWLCFLDADDELAPGFLDAMRAVLSTLDQGSAYLLTPAVAYVQGRRQRLPRARIWPRMDLRTGNWMVIGTLVPRDLFLEVGGFRDWPLYEDWCLWQRCEIAGAVPVEVPDAIYVAHHRHKSRNRALPRSERLRIHYEIVNANFPGYAA